MTMKVSPVARDPKRTDTRPPRSGARPSASKGHATAEQTAARTLREGSEELRVEQVAIGQLRPWAGNPRMMPKEEMASLQRSIEHYGMVQPIVARRADRVVIAGHQRLEAAKAVGPTSVPVIYVSLSETEAKALSLALNRIGGDWDLPGLGSLLEELQGLPDLDEVLTGFGGNEIDDLLATLERQSAADPREQSWPEAVDALQERREQAPTRATAGDLWCLGRHRVLCGDSLVAGALEGLCGGDRVDLVLTDPPYGIDYQSALPARGRRRRAIANDEASGFEDFLERSLPAIKAVMKRGGAAPVRCWRKCCSPSRSI
jgi:hypothetical protein